MRQIPRSPTDMVYLTGDFGVHLRTEGDFDAKQLAFYSMSLYTPVSAEVTLSPRWQMGTPIVTYWAGPMPMADAVAKQMADGGWNLAWVTRHGVDKDGRIVDHFRSH